MHAPAPGPRTSAPSATTTTNTDLLRHLQDAETYTTAARTLAEFDHNAERIAALIGAAERSLAAARNALAEATGTTTASCCAPGPWRFASFPGSSPAGGSTASCCAPGPWRYTGNAIESVDHGRWYAVAHVATEHFTPEAIAAHGAILAAAPELHQALKTLIADYRIGMAVVRPRTMTLIRAALAKAEGGAA